MRFTLCTKAPYEVKCGNSLSEYERNGCLLKNFNCQSLDEMLADISCRSWQKNSDNREPIGQAK